VAGVAAGLVPGQTGPSTPRNTAANSTTWPPPGPAGAASSATRCGCWPGPASCASPWLSPAAGRRR